MSVLDDKAFEAQIRGLILSAWNSPTFEGVIDKTVSALKIYDDHVYGKNQPTDRDVGIACGVISFLQKQEKVRDSIRDIVPEEYENPDADGNIDSLAFHYVWEKICEEGILNRVRKE